MTFNNDNSYQNGDGGAYKQVHVYHDEQNLTDPSSSSDELTRFWRNRRFIKAGLVAIVLSAVAACASSLFTATDNDGDRVFSLLRQSGSSPHLHKHKKDHCDYSVVVDDSGVLWDGPGADGTCNDTPTWYKDQLIDHFAKHPESPDNKWTQKCFINDQYFRGPGYPIFYIMGGEGDANCLFYPFVTHTLARIFGGMTMECEHRFYGKSQPIDPLDDVQQMIGLLTPDQAMMDYLRFLKVQQKAHHCSTDRSSPHYCPVVTVGASYPGFLSAMMRLVHGDVVDIAYASSAPLPLYAQDVDQFAYFDRVTVAADTASSGCAAAVKATLTQVQNDLDNDDDTADDFLTNAQRLGICASDKHPLPAYIQSNKMLWRETLYAVAANFAEFNMGNYPPSPDSDMNAACNVFQNTGWDAYEKIAHFWRILMVEGGPYTTECFDFFSQIPDGPNGTVMSADWTGGGDGKNGESWDFQQCTDLIVQTGYGPKSMFPYKPWTLEGLTKHCLSRFGVEPTPTRLVDQWHFDDLVREGASRFVFTNGLNDGWSADSILDNLSPDIVAINMPNGAHRSDLCHNGPRSIDTEDVKAAFPLIIQALTRWLTEIKAEMHQGEDCP